ncbi:MAG: Amino acid permease [Candidatus Tokpelaia hoelldobleri]|uniref:Amino acid permease n=1 Tax=Candidatus Tokpelaia hoelldobleri TaxID=1902579 RepID=A0A1U9JSG4_9HYPH|nr:MAG: Amino acid permease [Candidatus Tokpelaia hoelldoblerii]
MADWLRRKSVSHTRKREGDKQLMPTLSWLHLVALGIGGVVGTGIYTLIGVGAGKAGPAVLLAFVIAGFVCACAAFAYAELATLIPATGGAYTYSYVAGGEVLAWFIGWSLILEYSLVVGTVAIGWSGYMVGFLDGLGVYLPFWLAAGYDSVDPVTGMHGLINLPAVLIVFVIAGFLLVGTRESATVNVILVFVKIAALLVFVAVALPHFDPDNLRPFMPNGFFKTIVREGEDWVEKGVMAAAAIIFFAFYGFDTIATAAEEAKNPERDLSIGIIGSLAGCIVIYVLVGLAAVGAVPYTVFSASPEPLAFIVQELSSQTMATVIAAAAVVAMPTVLLAFFYGQTRIFFAMGRDGLLPHGLSHVDKKRGVPVATTIFTALVIAVLAGVARLEEIASLANAGTLAAFTAVGLCLLVLRVREPDLPRKFRVPGGWFIGLMTISGCVYLFYNLSGQTQMWFWVWNGIGIVFYFAFGFWKSKMRKVKR